MTSIAVGTLLAGQYSISKKVAENEYAVVFKAFDIMADGRPVAIKAVRVTGDDGVSLELFKRELDSLSRLRHPHIVRLIGSHDDAEYGPWLVLEWMDGGSLAAPDVRSRFNTADAQVLTLRALLDALSFAHLNHVLHRDIKPANILFATDGTAKLADFNVSKILQRATATRTVKHIFTAEYAAPEQSASRIATERSDIYSLGRVFIELVTGQSPGDDRAATEALESVPMRGSCGFRKFWRANSGTHIFRVFLRMHAVQQMLAFLYHIAQKATVPRREIYEQFFQAPFVKQYCDQEGIEATTVTAAEHRLPFLLNVLEACDIVDAGRSEILVKALALSPALVKPYAREEPEKASARLMALQAAWPDKSELLQSEDLSILRELFGPKFLTANYHLPTLAVVEG